VSEHLTFAINTSGSYPAWSTPNKSIPVTSASFAAARALNRFEDTGSTIRSRRYKSQGAVNNASGSISFRGYPVYLLSWMFRAFLLDAAQSAAGTGWKNDLLPDDTVQQLPWFSFQQRYAASVGQNARGAVLNQMTLSCAGGEELNVQSDFVVADVALAGGDWSDGSNSPSLVSAAYPATLPPPLRFHEGQIIFGGSVSKSTNALSLTGGTTIATFQSIQLQIANNAEGRYTVRDGAPTISRTRHGIRDITLSGDVDWSDFTTSHYDAMQAATETAVQLKFISDGTFSSGQNYQLIITLPRMVWTQDGAPLPDMDGSKAAKTQSLSLVAMEDETLATDIGVTFRTTDDLVP